MALEGGDNSPFFKMCGICTTPLRNDHKQFSVIVNVNISKNRIIKDDSSLESLEGKPKSVLSMLASVFQYPFSEMTDQSEFSRKIENWLIDQEPFLTCESCSKNVASFHMSFLQLRNLVHEASKLSNAIKDWRKLVTDSAFETQIDLRSTQNKRNLKSAKIKSQRNVKNTHCTSVAAGDVESISKGKKESEEKEKKEISMLGLPEVSNFSEPTDASPIPPRRTSTRIQLAKASPPKASAVSSSLLTVNAGKRKQNEKSLSSNDGKVITPCSKTTTAKISNKYKYKKSQRPQKRLQLQSSTSEPASTSPQCLCIVCHQLFSTIGVLIEHINSVHDASEPGMQIMKTENQVDASLETGKSEKITVKVESCPDALACLQCNEEFKSKQQLREHVLFHTENEPRFGCAICPKKFFKPKSLRKHLLSHSADKLTCSECGKFFRRSDHLKRHKRIHEREETKKNDNLTKAEVAGMKSLRHVCSECGKAFQRREYLEAHMRIHTGEKPFQCGSCGKAFRNPRNLSQHLVTHKTDRPFCCSVCGMTFKRPHHLNDHEKTHQENVERPFVCTFPLCEKAFKLKKHLVNHELVHSTSKNHTCHVCGKAFNRKDNLRQHIDKVHGKQLAEDLLEVVEKQKAQRQQSQTVLLP